VDGILVVAKPVGPTSHDVVGLIRRLSTTKRVGHGGTLDPFASGVLPIFLGKATRLVEYHLGDRKRYRATFCFGASSTTDDLEGELTPSAGSAVSREAVEAGLAAFRGPIQQRPPDYSAIKVAGRRAYAMARAGQAVELPPREVTIHAIEIVAWDGSDPDRPVSVVDIECSAGTYVRSLARDLGVAVGSAAYLGALVRTASGPFRLEAAIDLETIRTAAADDPVAIERLLLPVDAGLDEYPRLTVDAATIAALARGQAAALPEGVQAPLGRPILVADAAGRLVAVATFKDGRLAPDKVLVDLADATPTCETSASIGSP
jgi:tRNA pseudouridine55 synthase